MSDDQELYGRSDEDGREIARLEKRIRETEAVRDEWCSEFVKARNALKEIWLATEGCADGSPDATQHDDLCNRISAIAAPWKDAQP